MSDKPRVFRRSFVYPYNPLWIVYGYVRTSRCGRVQVTHQYATWPEAMAAALTIFQPQPK